MNEVLSCLTLFSSGKCFWVWEYFLHVGPLHFQADSHILVFIHVSFCGLAAAYYPATQQYPTSVPATPVMMNPAQQQPAPPPQQAPPQQSAPVKPRERKQVGGNNIWCVFVLIHLPVTYQLFLHRSEYVTPTREDVTSQRRLCLEGERPPHPLLRRFVSSLICL